MQQVHKSKTDRSLRLRTQESQAKVHKCTKEQTNNRQGEPLSVALQSAQCQLLRGDKEARQTGTLSTLRTHKKAKPSKKHEETKQRRDRRIRLTSIKEQMISKTDNRSPTKPKRSSNA